VLKEIPRVREDLGFLPLVTPTSQIVGTQAVLNVMTGERYKSISKETAGVLKGEYGKTPAPVNAELQALVLEDGGEVISCRPADLIAPEMDALIAEVQHKAKQEGVTLAANVEEDALINGLFVQVGWKFIANRGNPEAFEPAPDPTAFAASKAPKADVESYTVNINGESFDVAVGPGGVGLAISTMAPPKPVSAAAVTETPVASGAVVASPLAGNILKINVNVGAAVAEGDVVVIMEAMKMETEVRTRVAGTVSAINVKEGDTVNVGDALISL